MTIPPTVTDHALLRWFERVEGYDIEALRAAIARSGAIGIKYGARSVIIGKGKLVINEDVVITVLRRDHTRRDLIGHLEIELVDADVSASRRNRRRRR